MAARIRKGDAVIVVAGKYKNVEGTVLQVFPQSQRALVSGVGIVRKHQKQTAKEKGGIISRESPLRLCKIALKDPVTGKATRVGFKMVDGVKKRVAKKSGEVIDV